MFKRVIGFLYAIFGVYSKLLWGTLKAYWLLACSGLISFAIYVAFYQFYLPVPHHGIPLHFQFDSNCDRDIDDPICSFPKVSVSLHDSFEKKKDGIRLLTRGQFYDVHLDLVIPNVDSCKTVGMFMTKLDIISNKEEVIKSSSRSTLITAKGSLLTTLSSMIRLLPLLIGLIDDKEELVIPLFESFVDDPYTPAVAMNVTLLTKHLQFYSGSLRITAVFSGMRYYMHNWPYIFFSFTFPTVMALVFLFSLLRGGNVSSQGDADCSNSSIENVCFESGRTSVEDRDRFEDEDEDEEQKEELWM